MGALGLAPAELAAALADAFPGAVQVVEQGLELDDPHRLLGRAIGFGQPAQLCQFVAREIGDLARRREQLALLHGETLEVAAQRVGRVRVVARLEDLDQRAGSAVLRALAFDQCVESLLEGLRVTLGQAVGECERTREHDLEIAARCFVVGALGDRLAEPVGCALEGLQGLRGFVGAQGLGARDLEPAEVVAGAVARLAVATRGLTRCAECALGVVEGVRFERSHADVEGFARVLGNHESRRFDSVGRPAGF
jgi:hypothetical protein